MLSVQVWRYMAIRNVISSNIRSLRELNIFWREVTLSYFLFPPEKESALRKECFSYIVRTLLKGVFVYSKANKMSQKFLPSAKWAKIYQVQPVTLFFFTLIETWNMSVYMSHICASVKFNMLFVLWIDSVSPLYTDTGYIDKISYNDNLNVTKRSLNRWQLMRNYARILHRIFKQHMFWIFVRIAYKYPKHMLYEVIRIKKSISYISFVPLRIL